MAEWWSRFKQALLIEVRPRDKTGRQPNLGVTCQTCMMWIGPHEMTPANVANPSARKWCQDRGRGLCTAPVKRTPGKEDSVRATKPGATCERWISR